ncbi:MAG TPA: hypothetical protein HPP83_00225 [Candidatus Hydrogenedentes bacterium]|nr:hypothetical protein [Candidatus Hydrogenedentota bacterium]
MSKPALLPTIEFFGKQVSRLICGGNPLSGFSHQSAELDWEMISYYSMANIQRLLDACWRNGINAYQTRGDRFTMRVHLEHRQNGGQMHWIAQTASEFADIKGNIREIVQYGPLAIYHHGTHTDNCWHTGQIDKVQDVVKAIKDLGIPAGVASHIPDAIEYMEEKGWEVDFYMGCFYNLARQYKSAPATDQDAYARDQFPRADPPRMAAVLSKVEKPCLGFKILGAGRNCTTDQDTKAAFQFAFSHLKPSDAVVVGMFQKHKNQVVENAAIVREVLEKNVQQTG